MLTYSLIYSWHILFISRFFEINLKTWLLWKDRDDEADEATEELCFIRLRLTRTAKSFLSDSEEVSSETVAASKIKQLQHNRSINDNPNVEQ